MKFRLFLLLIALLFSYEAYAVEPISTTLAAAAVGSAVGAVARSVFDYFMSDPNQYEISKVQLAILKKEEERVNKEQEKLNAERKYFGCLSRNEPKLKGKVPEECAVLAEFYASAGGKEARKNISDSLVRVQ